MIKFVQSHEIDEFNDENYILGMNESNTRHLLGQSGVLYISKKYEKEYPTVLEKRILGEFRDPSLVKFLGEFIDIPHNVVFALAKAIGSESKSITLDEFVSNIINDKYYTPVISNRIDVNNKENEIEELPLFDERELEKASKIGEITEKIQEEELYEIREEESVELDVNDLFGNNKPEPEPEPEQEPEQEPEPEPKPEPIVYNNESEITQPPNHAVEVISNDIKEDIKNFLIVDLAKLGELDRLKNLDKLDNLYELENLRSLENLDSLDNLKKLDSLENLDSLDNLKKLDSLEQLDKLDKLDNIEQMVKDNKPTIDEESIKSIINDALKEWASKSDEYKTPSIPEGFDLHDLDMGTIDAYKMLQYKKDKELKHYINEITKKDYPIKIDLYKELDGILALKELEDLVLSILSGKELKKFLHFINLHFPYTLIEYYKLIGGKDDNDEK